MNDNPELFQMRDQRDWSKEITNEVRERCGENLAMVEIGSYAGESAEAWAKSGIFSSITCVDMWKNGYDPYDPAAPTAELAEKSFDRVAERYPVIHKMKTGSIEAASSFEDGSLDFVYIDADHRYESVKRDIKAWLPKVRKGGILAGHDYHTDCWPDVVRAVDETVGKPRRVFMDTSWMIDC